MLVAPNVCVLKFAVNTQMDPAEVLAVEIKHFVGQGQRTLIPRVLGQTAEAQQKKAVTAGETRQWDEPTFFAELEARGGTAQTQAARQIYNWSKINLPRFTWGKGKVDGSFIPVLDYKGTPYWFFTVYTYGRIEILFQFIKVKPPFADEALRMEFLRRLNEIPGVNLPPDAINRRPSLVLNTLSNPDALRKFFEALDWAVAQVKK